MLNRKFIINILGLVVVFEALFMFACALVAFFYDEGDATALLYSALTAMSIGGLAWLLTRKVPKDLIKREGFIVVTCVWIVIALFGSLPYILSGTIPRFTDAFFEAISGFTTTGASVVTDIESLPHGILLWRSVTHLLGEWGLLY